ncbi:hypothetical protein [Photorhabdus sp. CRCIA-P01]|nr:hypothetical protein [Photorhabdus sp. CRCIA-P01]
MISPYPNGLMIQTGQYPDLTPQPGSVPDRAEPDATVWHLIRETENRKN